MCASKRVVCIVIKYLGYNGNMSVVTKGEQGSQTLPQKAIYYPNGRNDLKTKRKGNEINLCT